MLHRRWWMGTGVAAGAVSMAMAGFSLAGLGSASAATGPVSSTPASGTPQLASTGTTEQVRQLVECNGTMYAVGRFTSIKWNGTTYARNNVFSFSATSPYTVTSWAPDVNGKINSIAFNGTDCTQAYIGGKFTSVDGTKVANIAEISTSTGAVNTSFGHTASGQVETLLAVDGHILAGGYYTTINGTGADKYMTSLNPTTGKDDGFLHLNISGHYHWCSSTRCTASNATRVYNQQLSHGGTLDLVEGDFTSVGGKARQQIFMLDLATTPATVTAWTSPEWDGSSTSYPYQCWYTESFYIRTAAWSPNDSTVYIGTTGYHPWNYPKGATPRTGLCDAAAAFPATQAPVTHKWVNYTGCDSLYSAAADDNTAYFAGHERWSQNSDDCDAKGPGAISAPGFEGLSPSNGWLTFNPTRARGLGADDMLVTGAGLWIASDNLNNANQCGGVYGHAGICLLPYSATASTTTIRAWATSRCQTWSTRHWGIEDISGPATYVRYYTKRSGKWVWQGKVWAPPGAREYVVTHRGNDLQVRYFNGVKNVYLFVPNGTAC